jgi:monoterpene epsilon-lactone hydrolase
VPAVFVEIGESPTRGVILHVHGGGFALGSALGPVGLVAALARKAGMRAVSVDYALAPENPYPAGLQDVIAAYIGLLEREGGADGIIVSGESVGGNLAVELLIAGKRRGLELPAAAILFSPMTDLTVSGDSYRTKADVDPNITSDAIRTRAEDYLSQTGTSSSDPWVSPIFADLTGLPALLIQVGSHEVLLDDATKLAARAAADNVAVTLDVTPGVPHVFQAFASILDEGDAALTRAGTFIKEHCPKRTDQ